MQTSLSQVRIAILLVLTLIALYLATSRGHFISTDEVTVYQSTRSLWEKGNVSVQIHNTRETMPGRGGAYYGSYNSGAAIGALPFYAIGRLADRLTAPDSLWRRVFAGHDVSYKGTVWGGEIPIFFVNLFNVFTTAALIAVFFILSMQMTQSARYSLMSALLLGTTTYIASLSSAFFQHTSEALFSLGAFTLFYVDRRRPDWRLRTAGGLLLGLMIQFRYAAVIALPALLSYHAVSTYLRQRQAIIVQRLRSAAWEIVPPVAAVAAGFGLHLLDQYWKFGSIRTVGYLPFSTPLAIGVYGYLFSPGMSIFLYSPVLVLLPFAIGTFQKRFPLETAFLALHSAVYLIVYSQYREWHGLWYFGPRYLSPLLPFLLLPIAVWIAEKRERILVPVLSLGAIGLWMQAIHVGVNYWSVILKEGYLNSGPHREFLFDPWSAPLLAHSRALLSGDHRVDMWLVDIARYADERIAAILAMVLTGALILGLMALAKEIERAEGGRVWRSFRYAAAGVPALILATVLSVHPAAPVLAAQHVPSARVERPAPMTNEQLMDVGVDALYRARNPVVAEVLFRNVLARDPDHYGANYQLAVALDRSQRASEAVAIWKKVLEMAESYQDQRTIDAARKRLASANGVQ